MSIVPKNGSDDAPSTAKDLSKRERSLLLATHGTDYSLIQAATAEDRKTKLLAPTMNLKSKVHEELYGIDIHPDGDTLINAGSHGNLNIYSVYGTCDLLVSINVGKKPIYDFKYIDKNTLIAAGEDGRTSYWDIIRAERINRYGCQFDEDPIFACRPSKDGNIFATGSSKGVVSIWDLRTDSAVQTVNLGTAKMSIESLCWDKDAGRLFCGTNRSSIILYDLVRGPRGSTINEFGREHEQQVTEKKSVGLNLRREAVMGKDGSLKMELARGIKGGGGSKTASFPLAVVKGKGNILEEFVESDIKRNRKVTGLSLNSTGEFLASFSGEVKVWRANAASTNNRYICTLPTGPVQNFEDMRIKLEWSGDGKSLGVGSANRNVYIYSDMERIRALALLDSSMAANGPYSIPEMKIPEGMKIERTPQIKTVLDGHRGVVTDVAWHPKEDILASIAADGTTIIGEIDF